MLLNSLFLNLSNPSSRIMALGLTQLLTVKKHNSGKTQKVREGELTSPSLSQLV
jgi:hypothetical protein